LPATPAITPLTVAIIANPTSAPSAAQDSSDTFCQIMQSVEGEMSGRDSVVPAPQAGDGSGPPVPLHPNLASPPPAINRCNRGANVVVAAGEAGVKMIPNLEAASRMPSSVSRDHGNPAILQAPVSGESVPLTKPEPRGEQTVVVAPNYASGVPATTIVGGTEPDRVEPTPAVLSPTETHTPTVSRLTPAQTKTLPAKSAGSSKPAAPRDADAPTTSTMIPVPVVSSLNHTSVTDVAEKASPVQSALKDNPKLTSPPSSDSSALRLAQKDTTDAERDMQWRPATVHSTPGLQAAPEPVDSDMPGQLGKVSVADASRQKETLPCPPIVQATAPNSMVRYASTPDHKITLRPNEPAVGAVQQPPLDAKTPELDGPTVMPATLPISTSDTAGPQIHPAKLLEPVEQIALVLLTLTKIAGGTQEVTVRLQPAELGMVQMRVARAASGATRIEITAEKSDTLQVLQRDQPQLHRTLDEAGVSAARRTITFHVAVSAHASYSNSESGTGGGSQNFASRASTGNTNAETSGNGGRGGYTAKESNGNGNGRRLNVSRETIASSVVASTKTYRVGLDITA
jgi:flagellar hook-length control protein FliK